MGIVWETRISMSLDTYLKSYALNETNLIKIG